MKWLILVLLFHLLLICSKCNKVINITSQDHLQSYLCQYYNYTGDTTLLLLDTGYNISGNGSLCIINTNYSLTIQGNRSMATIQCNSSIYDNTTYPTIGFAFTGSSNLILQRIKFTGCGANLTTLDEEQLDIINSTSSLVYFTQYHAAVLVFTDISHLVIRDVSIFLYYGFAIVAVNLPNSTLDSININASQGIEKAAQHKNGYSVGSGVLLMYQDSPKTLSYANHYNLIFTGSIFSYNFDYIGYSGYVCVAKLYNSYIYKDFNKPIINAAALTIFYIQTTTSVQVDISQCRFENNLGSVAGAMLIIHLEANTRSETLITNSVFDSNGSDRKCHGSGLVLFFDKFSRSSTTNEIYKPLQIIDVHFTFKNRSIFKDIQEGVVYIAMMNVKTIPICFTFSNVTFNNNKGLLSGSCIFAVSYPSERNNISFVLESIKAYNNGISQKNAESSFLPASLFKFSDINSIIIKGFLQNVSDFSFNYGTVIEAIRSDITLEGHVVFNNNTGIKGGAIMLIGNSVIYLTQGLQVNFTNNRALSSGGAIYDLSSTFDKTHCTFQVNATQHDDIAVLFENNIATVTGNSVYSSKLYNCYMNNYSWVYSSKAKEIYTTIFSFMPNNTFQLSTIPVNLKICHSNNSTILDTRHVYPGETVNFSMAAINAVDNYSYSIVSVAVVRNVDTGFTSDINWHLSESQSTQVIRETDDCTLINITIFTNDNNTLDMHKYGALLFTVPSIATIRVVDITLKFCPPGFELSLQTESCICSHLLSSINIDGYTPNCSINTRTFNRPTFTSWAGTINETSGLLLSLYCHHEYCNGDLDLTVLRYSNKDQKFEIFSKDLSITSSLCLHNREGISCGSCSTNYSVVFGSTECRQCSNWWLLTLVLYVVAGPLLIYLLYLLKLTLTTGTINGIIFYTQAANVGLYDILSINASQCSWLTRYTMKLGLFLISIMNLNIGFPLCFYNGMTELWKAGLSLLFPLYLLTIVVFIIILSRFSLKLSNRIANSSVQVLVTVVHLSFTKLLLSLSDVFTSVHLYNSTMNEPINVWYNDGSIIYREGKHFVLMIVTSVIVGIFIIPYMLVILTGRLLMKSSKIREYLRPIYEAIHAPYKCKKQYWFAARQLLLIYVSIVYTIYRGKRINEIVFGFLIVIPVYMLFVTVQAYLKPFKNKLVNVLDLSVMINYGTLLCTNWYFIGRKKYYCTAGVFDATFIYVLIFTFSVVVFHHIVLVTRQQARFIGYLNVAQNFIKKFTQLVRLSQPVKRSRHYREELNSSFFDEKYSEYREPLLSP